MSREQAAARYRIDASRSRFTAKAFAEGLLSVFGHDPLLAVCGFGGDVRFSPDAPEAASLLLLVRADSLAVVGEVGEKDRREVERVMREEVLETARYPEIVYMSRSVSASRAAEDRYRVAVSGDLSLHGVTRSQQVNAEVFVDGDGLRARGEFSLRQSDYNIRPVSFAAGTLKVRDEVKLSFDIAARES